MFNAQSFLDTAGVSRKVMDYHKGESIYSQGEAAPTVMYIQEGGVRLSVVNGSGKEAVAIMSGFGTATWQESAWTSASAEEPT